MVLSREKKSLQYLSCLRLGLPCSGLLEPFQLPHLKPLVRMIMSDGDVGT